MERTKDQTKSTKKDKIYHEILNLEWISGLHWSLCRTGIGGHWLGVENAWDWQYPSLLSTLVSNCCCNWSTLPFSLPFLRAGRKTRVLDSQWLAILVETVKNYTIDENLGKLSRALLEFRSGLDFFWGNWSSVQAEQRESGVWEFDVGGEILQKFRGESDLNGDWHSGSIDCTFALTLLIIFKLLLKS